jgi:hypothetical protein
MIAGAALAIGLLLSGWSDLETRLPGGLPVGNALSAAAVILAAWAAALLTRRGTVLYRLCVAALGLAILWLPVSIAIAGNLDLNFRRSTGPAWFAFTALTLLASFGALLAALVSTLRHRRSTSRAK